MQIPVAIEPLASGQFRAQSLPPFTAVAEGATTHEALQKVRTQLDIEVQAGKQIVMLDVAAKQENPWLAIAGSLKDHPLLEEWKAAMEEYRRQCDIEAGIDLSERE